MQGSGTVASASGDTAAPRCWTKCSALELHQELVRRRAPIPCPSLSPESSAVDPRQTRTQRLLDATAPGMPGQDFQPWRTLVVFGVLGFLLHTLRLSSNH